MISRLRKKMAAEGKISLDFRSYSSKDGGILWVAENSKEYLNKKNGHLVLFKPIVLIYM
jgi:hypothetical protein